MKATGLVKNSLSNFLATVLLLVGFFISSGLVSPAASVRTATQITIIVKAKTPVGNYISYRIPAKIKNQNKSYLTRCAENINRVYNQRVAANFKTHLNKAPAKTVALLFFQAKTIPQNGEDEPAVS